MAVDMSLAGLPALEGAAQDIIAQLAQHRVVAVEGPPASGKSTVLRAVESDLRKAQRSAVFLSVRRVFGFSHLRGPRELLADDAASVLLASTGAQLEPTGDGLLDLIKDASKSWSTKLDAVRATAQQRQTVFVIDEVPSFDHRDRPLCSIFEQRTFEVLEAFNSTPNTRLVFGSNTPSFAPARVQIPRSNPIESVLSPSRWNGLGDAARNLLSQHEKHAAQSPLEHLSPLELRLAVALVHLGESLATLFSTPLSLGALIDRVFARIEKGDLVRKVLGRLALVRVPFRSELIDVLGGSSLSVDERKMLETCILFGERDELHLHELLRAAATRRGWAGYRNREPHRLLGEYHRSQFELARTHANLADATVHELELVHHLTQAGDESDLGGARVYFAEQYDALGKALSLRRRYAAAVQAYDRALEHSPDDWYAHHYRAFNRDVSGLDADKVEEGYEKAVELEPQHLWNHSRLISFYVTRSRTETAEKAWRRFRDLFGLSPIASDPMLYDSVHKHVARLLLHRGELDFARRVLDDVPGQLQRDLPWHRALKYFHDRLVEAEIDNVVFPTWVDPNRRWAQPHTVGDALATSVTRWQPGRVSSVAEDFVHIRVARHEGDGVEFGWSDLDLATLAQTWGMRPELLSAGTFVELLWLSDGKTLMMVHAPRDEPIPGLPGLWPPPDRYIRHRVLSGHESS